jgi:hypothetical protein
MSVGCVFALSPSPLGDRKQGLFPPAKLLARALARDAEEGRKEEKKATCLPTYLFLIFFEIFRSDFRKYFYGVLGLLMQRNGQKPN